MAIFWFFSNTVRLERSFQHDSNQNKRNNGYFPNIKYTFGGMRNRVNSRKLKLKREDPPTEPLLSPVGNCPILDIGTAVYVQITRWTLIPRCRISLGSFCCRTNSTSLVFLVAAKCRYTPICFTVKTHKSWFDQFFISYVNIIWHVRYWPIYKKKKLINRIASIEFSTENHPIRLLWPPVTIRPYFLIDYCLLK